MTGFTREDSYHLFLCQLRLLSFHHLYCCASFVMCFSLTLPVHSAWNGSQQALVPVKKISTKIAKTVVDVVQSTVFLVQRKRCLGKCCILIFFFLFMKKVHKGQTKRGFFLYWYNWINPSPGQSCLSPSS